MAACWRIEESKVESVLRILFLEFSFLFVFFPHQAEKGVWGLREKVKGSNLGRGERENNKEL